MVNHPSGNSSVGFAATFPAREGKGRSVIANAVKQPWAGSPPLRHATRATSPASTGEHTRRLEYVRLYKPLRPLLRGLPRPARGLAMTVNKQHNKSLNITIKTEIASDGRKPPMKYVRHTSAER